MDYLTANQVKVSLQEDTQVYMLLASLNSESNILVNELPVVCDFSDVFSNDMSSLPPTREVEFSIDLVPGTGPISFFTYNNSYHSSIGVAPYEALYGRRCRTPLCWCEPGDKVILGPEIVQQTTDKVRMIQERMRAAQSRQKSYADRRRKDLEFQEGDHVFLKFTPWTRVGRALKSRKLTPRFIGPFQILKRVGSVAYQIALPPNLSNLHDVFHTPNFRNTSMILCMRSSRIILRLRRT
uniref:Retrotransposable element Tf2 n=1 Tax=Cajanus cajan TaxID=3821 RepID=A0A151RDF4_CAJCA|nr:Retrotransposable element Tf2 [Cajanus cajan]